ncbi:MAG: hypothetical protein ACJ790_15185 [Myxococcaceae bacterium]
MNINQLRSAALKLITDAAGADGALTKTEASKLPQYMRERIEAVRKSSHAKVSVSDAFGAVMDGTTSGVNGLFQDLFLAQGGKQAKGPSDISQGELNAFPPALKDVTTELWKVAETSLPPKPQPSELKKKDLDAAVTLLAGLVHKTDNGDQVMTPVELARAKITYGGKVDAAAADVLGHAINRAKNEGGRDLASIEKVLNDAKAELLALNTDGNATLSPAELGHAKSILAKSLIAFAAERKGAKLSDYTTTPEKLYVPTTPFKPPANATAAEYVQALTKHFDAFSNDNKGAGANNISRFVMGTLETEGMAKEIAKLPVTFRKQVLKALEARVQQDPNVVGDPQRIYFTPDAEPLISKVARDANIHCNFKGVAAPPKFDYF